MLKKSKLGLIAALVLGALAALVPAASATTVTVSPGGGVTGTATTPVQWTFNTARRTLSCSSAVFTAGLLGGSTTITTNWVPTYVPCTLTGGLSVTGPCGTSSLNITGLTSGGLTPVSLTGFNCTPSLSPTCYVHLNGSLSGRFNNSGSQLSIAVTGQSLTATGSTCASLPNDSSITHSSTIPGGAVVYNVSPSQTINAV